MTVRNKSGDETEAGRKFASANGEYIQAQSDYDEAVAAGYATDKLKQTIEDYEEQISKCNVTATSSGTVVSLNATVGSPISTNSTIATIADTGDLKVSVSLDEYDIQKVTKGMKATVTTDAVDGTFNATVTSVSLATSSSSSSSSSSMSSSSSSSSSGYAVTVTLDEQTTKLLIGMNVKVTIIVSSDEDVYTVPIDAVGTDSSGNSVIYVKQSDDTYSPVTVTTGDSNDYYIVVSGDSLSDGMVIRASADATSAAVAQPSASASSDSGLNLNLGGATGGGNGGGGSAPQGGGGGSAPQGGGPGGN
jgi:multidrug efflux pump subunit AcrA (membrane-fusion protein)